MFNLRSTSTRAPLATPRSVRGGPLASCPCGRTRSAPTWCAHHSQLRDDCDPTSFNAVLSPTGPPACVGDGDRTFPDFIADVTATGSSDKWRFNPVRTEADRGVTTENRGGETHSFTEVAHFGGGFVEALNGGMAPLTECAARTPDGTLIRDAQGNLVPALPAIRHLFPPARRVRPR
jgi:hypothetical protein